MFLISATLTLELSMNGCRKAKVSCTKKREFNSKIRIFLKDFLALLKSLHVKNFIEKKSSWYDMRPLDQKGLNIWVWNCIKELCKESGEVLGLTSNHLKVGPPQTLRASPSWHFPKNASTFTKGLVPFTQLVKVRRVTWFWHFRASDFHETFTRSSLTLNMSRKLLLDP